MIRINLLKPETKEVREAAAAAPEARPKKAPNIGNLIFLLLILVLIGFYWMQKRSFDKETRLLENARFEKAQLAYVTARLEAVNRQKADLERKINLINSLKAEQDLAVRILYTLSSNLPDWVWLTEATYDAKGVQIKGKALSNNLIADYIGSLEQSPVFKNVNLGSSQARKAQKSEYLEFVMNMSIEKAVEPAPAEKPGAKKGGVQ